MSARSSYAKTMQRIAQAAVCVDEARDGIAAGTRAPIDLEGALARYNEALAELNAARCDFTAGA